MWNVFDVVVINQFGVTDWDLLLNVFGRPDDMTDLGKWKAFNQIGGDVYAPGDFVL